MGECAKQLTDAVAVTRASGMPRCAVGRGHPERRSGIRQPGELWILAQAGQHAATRVGDDELERAVARGIGDDAALRPAAVLEDIVHQLAEGAHQPGSQSPRQSRRDRRVLGMLGPLLPDQAFGAVAVRIEARQREYAGPVAGARAADRPLSERTDQLVKHRRLDHHRTVGGGQGGRRHRQFDQRSDPARPTERNGPEGRQPSGNGLPKQIVGRLKARTDPLRLPVHSAPRPRLGHTRAVCCFPASPQTGLSRDGCSVVDFSFKHHRVPPAFRMRTSH